MEAVTNFSFPGEIKTVFPIGVGSIHVMLLSEIFFLIIIRRPNVKLDISFIFSDVSIGGLTFLSIVVKHIEKATAKDKTSTALAKIICFMVYEKTVASEMFKASPSNNYCQ